MASLPFQRPNYAFKNVIATYIESAVDVTICRACMFHVSIIRNIFFIKQQQQQQQQLLLLLLHVHHPI